MKKTLLLLSAALLAAALFTACKTEPKPPIEETPLSRTTRNNAYSLLHQLMDEEKDVSFLRFIKREDDDVKLLVNKIAKFSGTTAKRLKEFAAKDKSLALDDFRLPPAEVQTRDAIAATKQKLLLHSKGDDFRVALLLTQSESMNYGAHLALVASRNEPDRERSRLLLSFSEQMRGLSDEVVGLLQIKPPARK